MAVKRCAWGRCNSDSRYSHKPRMENVKFHPFPKPWINFERCQAWIKACGRPHEQLNTSKITKYYYVCSKHFVEGRPSVENPDPVHAEPCSRRRRHPNVINSCSINPDSSSGQQPLFQQEVTRAREFTPQPHKQTRDSLDTIDEDRQEHNSPSIPLHNSSNIGEKLVEVFSKQKVQRLDNAEKLRSSHRLLTFKDKCFIDSFGPNLYDLQQKGYFCDLQLNGLNDQPILVHKLVFLACGSAYFTNALLKSDSDTAVIGLPFSYAVLMILVRYVYTGEIVIQPDDAIEFLRLCEMLKLNRVKDFFQPLMGEIDRERPVREAQLPITALNQVATPAKGMITASVNDKTPENTKISDLYTRISDSQAKRRQHVFGLDAKIYSESVLKLQESNDSSENFKSASISTNNMSMMGVRGFSEGDIVIKREADATIVDILGTSTNSQDSYHYQNLNQMSENKCTSSTNREPEQFGSLGDIKRRKSILVEKEPENCAFSSRNFCFSNDHDDIDPNIKNFVIKSEPHDGHDEATQSEDYLKVDLGNGDSLRSINTKEESSL